MKLIKSQVVFNPNEHTYMLGDKELSGITSVISRQLSPINTVMFPNTC